MSELALDPHPVTARVKTGDHQVSYGATDGKSNDNHGASQELQSYNMGDKAVMQLLSKLDEGMQTIANLRSILTLKTAELNELIAQLELTNQAIMNVESTTTQIETMLKDLGLSNERETLLMNAEATLDSAIKSASSLYETPPKIFQRRQSVTSNSSGGNNNPLSGLDQEQRREQRMSAIRFGTRIRYKPDTKHILRQLNDLLRDLELDSAEFYKEIGTMSDVQTLQKAKVDLDIAKTIALSAKSNLKRRTILLRSARKRNAPDEVKMLGSKIRESVALWKNYVRGAPLRIDGEDILDILDREDELISKNLPVHPSRISYDGLSRRGSLTPSTSATNRSMHNSLPTRSNDSSGAPVRPGHGRAPSIASTVKNEADIPPVPPLNAAAATSLAVKKMHRHSAAARTPIRASTGVPRVRTSSLTGHKIAKDSSNSSKPPAVASKKDLPPSSIPAPAPPSPSVATDSTTRKSSMIKPPSQRGPGSTLRIRSMLAKRNIQTPPSQKEN